MTLRPYSMRVVHDREGNKAYNSTGTLYAEPGMVTQVPALNHTGSAIALTSDVDGVLPDFYVEDRDVVYWKAAGFAKPFPLVTTAPVPGEPGTPGRDGANVLPTEQAIYQELESGASAALLSATTASAIDAATGTQIEAQRGEVFRKAFLPPLAQDYPAITVKADTASTLYSTGTRFRAAPSGQPANMTTDPAFRYDSTPSLASNLNEFVTAPLLTGGNAQAARYNYTAETITTSANSLVGIFVRMATPTLRYNISVDGKWLQRESFSFAGNAGSWQIIELQFPVAKPRVIKFMTTGEHGFGGMIVPSGQTLTRPLLPINLRVAIIGDSYEGGTGVYPDGATRLDTAGVLAAKMLGSDSIWNFGIGSTGWVAGNNNGTPNPFHTRIADVLAINPNILIFSGSINDGAGGSQAIRDAVTSALGQVASIPEVYVTGPSLSAAYEGNNTAVRESTLAAGRPYLDALEPELWLSPSMIGPDNVHPNALGHHRRASRIHEGISAVKAP